MKTQTQSSLKVMFKLAMLALLMVVFSCSQETVLDSELDGTENLNAQAAKGKKGKRATRAIRAKLNNSPAVPVVTFTGRLHHSR